MDSGYIREDPTALDDEVANHVKQGLLHPERIPALLPVGT